MDERHLQATGLSAEGPGCRRFFSQASNAKCRRWNFCGKTNVLFGALPVDAKVVVTNRFVYQLIVS